ncbi:hypothetical protein WEI85_00385 [Actinomycetes bacterium KLBMP 9797]
MDCLAWGATRKHQWLCHGCFSWRKHNPSADACTICSRRLHVGNWGRDICRLCYKQASMLLPPDGKLDLTGANRPGQQLFLADMFLRKGMRRPKHVRPPLPTEPARAGPARRLRITSPVPGPS